MEAGKRFIFLILVALGAVFPASAEKIDDVEGEFTYYGRSDESPAQCVRKAQEYAIADALQRRYGTIVTQSLVQTESVHGEKESSDFMMLSSSEVNGQWLGTTGEPEKKITMDADGNVVATVRIKGRASRIGNKATQYEGIVMRNGTDRKRFASADFKAGDSLYAYFSAPVNGFLSMFLADEQGNVCKIFPYTTSPDGQARMTAGYEYILFDDKRHDNAFGTPDGLQLTANGLEYNKVYMIFSPEEYSLPPLKFQNAVDGMLAPPSTDYAAFTKWLARLRATDERLGVKLINITIKE